MMEVSLIIPTYNEKMNLRPLVEEIFNYLDDAIDLEIIFVDDNSPDKTADEGRKLAQDYPIRVIERGKKIGLGSAVRAGFGSSTRPILGVMDADLSHDPKIINELIYSLKDNDIVIGSRFESKSRVLHWQFYRKAISKIGVWFARILTNIDDPLSGYFFLKRSVIENVDLTTKGYKILFEILVKGHYKKVKEIAYTFRERVYSQSKLNMREYARFVGQLFSYTFYKLK